MSDPAMAPLPSAAEITAAVHRTLVEVRDLAPGPHPPVESTAWCEAPLAVRAAVLALLGAHYAVLVRPAERRVHHEASVAVAGGLSSGGWAAIADRYRLITPSARLPVRCDHCHHRIGARRAA